MTRDSRHVSRKLFAAGAAIAVAAAIVPAQATTCNTVAACVLGTNTGAGYGVEGTSASGNGVSGLTTFSATSTSNAKAGLFGADGTTTSTNIFNFGVLGTSTYGTGTAGRSVYRTGVAGTSTSGYGVEGDSTSGVGVVGVTLRKSTGPTDAKAGVAGFDNSTSGSFDAGVYGSSARGMGIYGSSASGNGVNATSHSGIALSASVDQADLGAGGSAIAASAGCIDYHCQSGYAGFFTANGTAIYAEGGTPYPADSIPALYAYQQIRDAPTIGMAANAGEAVAASGSDYGVVAEATGSNGTAIWAGPNSSYLFRGGGDLYGLGKPDTVSIDVKGNMILAGTLTVSGTPNVVVRDSDGSASVAYGARTTQPSIEDFGEARLAAGRAFVAIDAALARSIDASRGYLVFITPQGETNGLYVTQKTARGFTVQEVGTSRSSVAFDYRIVAHAYGESSAGRLPGFVPLTHTFKRAVFIRGGRTLRQTAANRNRR